jgi:hypothetical protein
VPDEPEDSPNPHDNAEERATLPGEATTEPVAPEETGTLGTLAAILAKLIPFR